MTVVTYIYAALMFLLGLIGFLSNPSKALSSLIVGVGVAIVFALFARFIKRKGIQTIMTLVAALVSFMLVWRVNMAWMAYFSGSSEKFLAACLMSVMLVLSLVMTGLGIIVPRSKKG